MTVDENYKWFEENYEELKKRYKDKFLIIQNQSVYKSFSTFEDAIKYSKTLKAGTYIIQKCAKNKDDLIQIFHTRVRFND